MKRARTLLIIACLLAVAGRMFFFYFYYQPKCLAEKAAGIKELQETFVPVRFWLLERAASSVRSQFRFYSMHIQNIEDVDMEPFSQVKEVAPRQIVDITGTQLFVDSVKISNGELLPYDPEQSGFFHTILFPISLRLKTRFPYLDDTTTTVLSPYTTHLKWKNRKSGAIKHVCRHTGS